jgi:hypothetical protein
MPGALLHEIEVVSVETNMAAAHLLDGIRVVRVDLLAERLRHFTPLEVLNSLFSTDELLTQASAGDRCALLSYRQERGTNGLTSSKTASFAHLTMDDDALRGVIAAARKLGVDSIWCDGWCMHARCAAPHLPDSDQSVIHALHTVRYTLYCQMGRSHILEVEVYCSLGQATEGTQ